jgi:hypothetical protein
MDEPERERIYRNVAVRLPPDPDHPGARFSRDHWQVEIYHRRVQYRSTGPTQERKQALLFHKKRNKPANDNAQRPAKYAREQMQPEHGAYSRVGFEDRGASFRVLGRCSGPLCGGHVRKFEPSAWFGRREGMLGCHKCAGKNALMRLDKTKHETAA